MSASSKAAFGETSLTTTRTSRSPAFCDARQRRSPAMISSLSCPGTRRTTIGSSSPCSLMDAASSSSLSFAKCWRGWPFCGVELLERAREHALVAVLRGRLLARARGGARRGRGRARGASSRSSGALIARLRRPSSSRACAAASCLSEELAREREVALRALRLHVVEDARACRARAPRTAARCAG